MTAVHGEAEEAAQPFAAAANAPPRRRRSLSPLGLTFNGFRQNFSEKSRSARNVIYPVSNGLNKCYSLEKMSAISKIVHKLRKYPSAHYSVVDNTITVEPADCDGFSVWLTEKNPGYTVGYDGWHDEFDDEEDALAAFAFGLSDDCRLKIIRRGESECVWIVEGRDKEGQWSGDSTTGLFLTPFWRKKSIVFRQNRLIVGSESNPAE